MYSFDPHRMAAHINDTDVASKKYANNGGIKPIKEVYIKPLFSFAKCKGCKITIASGNYCLRCSETIKNIKGE